MTAESIVSRRIWQVQAAYPQHLGHFAPTIRVSQRVLTLAAAGWNLSRSKWGVPCPCLFPAAAFVAISAIAQPQRRFGRPIAIAKAVAAPHLRPLHRFSVSPMAGGSGRARPRRPMPHPKGYGATFVRAAGYRWPIVQPAFPARFIFTPQAWTTQHDTDQRRMFTRPNNCPGSTFQTGCGANDAAARPSPL